MKICILACHVMGRTNNGSNTIYLKRFLSNLPPSDNEYTILAGKEGINILKPLYPDFKYEEYEVDPYFFSLKKFWITISEARRFQKFMNERDYDCLFITHFFSTFARLPLRCKKVSVIHDVIQLHHSISSLRDIQHYFIFRYHFFNVLKNSDKVIAISEFVKKDILHFYPQVNSSKIIVVPNSIDIISQSSPIKELENQSYILFVGRLAPYKGFITMANAFEKINNGNLKLVFVCGKDRYWYDDVMASIRKNNIEDSVIHLTGISDYELKWLYENATIYVTASEHEGFGYTPVEAAIYGSPVISSKCDALPESTLGLVYYYEPVSDSEALAEKITEVLNNYPTKENLQQIAIKLRRQYSPKHLAKQILNILTEIQ